MKDESSHCDTRTLYHYACEKRIHVKGMSLSSQKSIEATTLKGLKAIRRTRVAPLGQTSGIYPDIYMSSDQCRCLQEDLQSKTKRTDEENKLQKVYTEFLSTEWHIFKRLSLNKDDTRLTSKFQLEEKIHHPDILIESKVFTIPTFFKGFSSERECIEFINMICPDSESLLCFVYDQRV